LLPPRPPVERPLVLRPLLPLLVRPPALIPLELPRPLALIPLLLPRPEDDLAPDEPRELPELPLEERELPEALRDEPVLPLAFRPPPDALRLELPLPLAPRLLPAALRELPAPADRELPDALREPLEPALAPRLRVRSSTSPVSALSAACVESSDVMPRPITRERPVDSPEAPPDLPVLPPAFVPPLRFEAMPSSR
jgi:hypothetical protein